MVAWEYNDTVIYPGKVRLNCYYYRQYSFVGGYSDDILYGAFVEHEVEGILKVKAAIKRFCPPGNGGTEGV